MPISFLDTNVLSNFANVQATHLLPTLFQEDAATTPAVSVELQVGSTLGRISTCDWSWLTVFTLSAKEQHIALMLRQQIGAGEAECVAVAGERSGIFCSDDLAARRLAQNRGISVSGTLTILVALVKKDILSALEANSLLQAMVRCGYRSPVRSLESWFPDLS